jgi:signal transduction histidine kinase/CheY-like chemotaxis protein
MLALLVLGLTGAASSVAWTQARASELETAQRHFERRTRQLSEMLSVVAGRSVQLANSAVGLVESSEHLTRDEWERFTARSLLTAEVPGVDGLAFIERVPETGLSSFIERARGDGAADYDRRLPPGMTESTYPDAHYMVLYKAPSDLHQAYWGIDLAASPATRQVFDRASEPGRIAFELLSRAPLDGDGPGAPVVFLAIPAFGPARAGEAPGEVLSGLLGWVGLSIDLAAYFDAVVTGHAFDGAVALRLRTEGEFVDVYRTADAPRPGLIQPVELHGSYADNEWSIRVEPGESFAPDFTAANRTGITGLLISLLVSTISLLISRTGHRATRLAEAMTEDLRRSEVRLRDLAERAEESSRLKSLFIANMSHDVRTPMTAILGYTRVLEDELGARATGPTGEALAAIQRSGEHLLHLINDVLDLSKIEANRLVLASEPFSVRDLISGSVSVVRSLAEAKGISLMIELGSPVPARLVGDEARLRQVLLNLLGNAVKFTERGGVRLLVSAPAGAGAGESRLVLKIEDSGIGMSPDQVARVFQPFVQADPSHTRRFGGTGLGLTIARRLVEAMNGSVEIESEPGVGSRFRVSLTLPISGAEVIEDPETLSEPERPWVRAEGADGAPTGGRVLLVEDGPDNQRLVAYTLGKSSVEIRIESDGEAGLGRMLEAWEQGEPFDLVLLDMQIPTIDGYTVASRARARGYTGRIVALTAHAMTGDRERCLRAGCDGYLSKPFRPEDLLGLVRWATQERAEAA